LRSQAEVQRLKNEFVKISREVYDRGLVSATGGNLSVRIPGTDKVLMKPTGLRLRDLTTRDLLVVDLDQRIVEGRGRPSKEQMFHLGIYKVREDARAVLHTHPPVAIAVAGLSDELPLPTAQAKSVLKKVPVIAPAPPGSKELAELVIEAFKGSKTKAILLKEHGAVTIGKDLMDAFNNAELLEEAAKVVLYSRLLKR
jgi:L-fuculose-phosphate aldolase